MIYIAAILAASAIFSCSGVKNLKEADLGDFQELKFSQDNDTATIADMAWWKYYSDSTLCNIIDRTLRHNRSLMMAASRVEQARALYGIDKANFFPEVTAMAGADYETNDYYDKSFKKDPEYDLKLTVAWEANLWGSLSWAKRKGAAGYLASVDDERAMRMTLVAEVAKAYFTLLALDNELAIVRRTLVNRKEGMEKARIRYEGGLTSEVIYQQAKVEYASTASLIPNLEQNIALARNAIFVLMGEYPGERLTRGQLDLESIFPETLPVGIPSELLTRRPDLRAAEHRLKAAMADVGLNYADRFPRFRIAFTGGFENDGLAHLLQSPFTYTIGSVAGSVFDFGRKKRKYQASIAAYDQSRLAYEQSVLNACREVYDAIVVFRKARERSEVKKNLRDAAKKYVDLTHIQYAAGDLLYINLLDAQRRYLDAQIEVSNAVRDEYLAMVSLYKALGGGWTTQ